MVHVDHLKSYMGRQTPEEWRENEIITENENDTFDNFQDFDSPSKDCNLVEMTDVQTPKPRDSESAYNESYDDQFLTPPTPKRTHYGRAVRKPLKYSPD